MADTYSPLLRLRLQKTGANQNTWGELLNISVAQLLEDAIAGAADIVVAGTDVTLSANDGADDQARMAVLNLTGSPGASRNILVPALSKPYIVINATGFAQTIKTATGTGVTVPNGSRQQLYCDGTNVAAVTTPAALAFVTVTDGAIVTIDCTTGTNFIVTLAGNRTLAFSNPQDGQTIELWIKQDGTGNRTVTWPGNVQFDPRVAPRLSTAAGAIDRFVLTYNATENRWIVLTGVPKDGFLQLTDASTVNVPCNRAQKFFVTLAGNRALALNDPRDGEEIEIWFIQDAGGGRTISWPANVRFGTGSSPTLSTSANAIDAYRLTYHASNNIWVAQAIRNVSPASGATTFDLTIPASVQDLHLHSALGAPSGILTVNLRIPRGLVVSASSAGGWALDTTGFESGSEINVFNEGYIIGAGGNGGRGSSVYESAQSDTAIFQSACHGYPGGHAIRGPGAGRTLNLHNATGFVYGGGGGGGGGGARSSGGIPSEGSGGGGGGGAGGGNGGDAGAAGGTIATNGKAGSPGPVGAGGDGGAGASAGPAAGSAGGAGGGYGESGSDGVAATAATLVGVRGAGGAAGRAVDVNGATVTFVSGGSSPNVRGAVA